MSVAPQSPAEVAPTLRLTDLTHTYQGAGLEVRRVLKIDQWTLAPGGHVLLRGVSGSGKTTLLNILSGILKPTTGSVELCGQRLFDLSEAVRDRFRAQHIGYIYQAHYLLAMSALDNVEMPLAFMGQPPAVRRRRAAECLERVGLGDVQHHRPDQLSTGQRLRVTIARALVARPAVLLADEPTAALDPDSAEQAMNLIQSVCREVGALLICASHDPALSDRFPLQYQFQRGELHPLSPTEA